ncbi:hypothetical protein OBV_p-00190 (plasmid) [Oscillibacter valericigenes Sjm18-20]|nr:hypothetical protein OBV_p-00190 [Oscillibacter valericigenes Sjm18-20]
MNRRKLKKKLLKCLPAFGDEANLLLMTEEERNQALRERNLYEKKYGYRKTYRRLKKERFLPYYFSIPKSPDRTRFVRELLSRVRKSSTNIIVTQSLSEIGPNPTDTGYNFRD